jgi:hypothetical protein
MQFPHVLIDRCSSLCAAIAVRVVEIQGVDGEFTDGTLKLKAAIQRLGGVIAHI